MKRAYAVALSTCAVIAGMSTAQADWSVGAGFEHFRWRESTSPSVEEDGLRLSLGLSWQQSKDPGLSAGYEGKFYVGNVDYTGAFIGTAIPFSGETHYRGISNEIQSWYRTPSVDFLLGVGYDHWTRDITASQRETWDTFYVRTGVATSARVRQGFIGSLGVKYTFYTREDAHLTDAGFTSNPRLRPGADWSLYATAGYRVNSDWEVFAYYDAMYWKKSNTVAVNDGVSLFQVWQPRSKQDVLGMKVQRNF